MSMETSRATLTLGRWAYARGCYRAGRDMGTGWTTSLLLAMSAWLEGPVHIDLERYESLLERLADLEAHAQPIDVEPTETPEPTRLAVPADYAAAQLEAAREGRQ